MPCYPGFTHWANLCRLQRLEFICKITLTKRYIGEFYKFTVKDNKKTSKLFGVFEVSFGILLIVSRSQCPHLPPSQSEIAPLAAAVLLKGGSINYVYKRLLLDGS